MVSIPFKREGVSKENHRRCAYHDRLGSFHSLQTGRRIQSYTRMDKDTTLKNVSIPFKREGVSKECGDDKRVPRGRQVSIPFKREGVSKVITTALSMGCLKRFNSLQTGRRIQSMQKRL